MPALSRIIIFASIFPAGCAKAQRAPALGRIHTRPAAELRQGISVAYTMELYAKRGAPQTRFTLTGDMRWVHPERNGSLREIRSGLRLSEGRNVLGFEHHALHGFAKGFDPGAYGALRGKLEILVQVVQKGAVIFFAAMDVGEQEVSFREIRLLAKRLVDTFLGLHQTVQTEQRQG